MKTCSIEGCDNIYSGKGLCAKHYAAEYRKNNREKHLASQRKTNEKYKERNRIQGRERYYANQEANLANKKRYREENPEKIKNAQQKWYAENREKAIADAKTYVENNKEKVKARRKSYHEANREELNAKKRADRERIREVERAWVQANPEKVRDKNRKRLAMQNNAEYDGWTESMVWERDNSTCQICFKIVPRDLERSDRNNPLYPHIDHIVALIAGGSHLFINVRLTHRVCNLMRTPEQEAKGL